MSVAIVLANLRMEGGPALAADLAAEWRGYRPVVLCLNDEAMEYAPRFYALGVPIEVLGVSGLGPRHSIEIARKVALGLRRHKAKAIISIPSGIHGPIFAGGRLAGVKQRVVHVGNYPWHWHRDFWKYRMLMRLSAPLTPDLVCVTEHVAEGVRLHFGRVARRIHVIANGIATERFPFRGPPRPVEGRPIEIVMVARLDSGKNHAALIEAVRILLERGEAVRLTIVGDGGLRREIECQAAPLGDAVRVLGARRDVPELLAAADVFAFIVQPEEGLGIALVEAMAAGLPIIASDVGACREVLEDGRCGVLVTPGAPQALADALLVAGRQPDAVTTQAARTRAETVYGRATMAKAYAALCGLS
jgi:glycosyltransferase involved in cell wall biosynthesis